MHGTLKVEDLHVGPEPGGNSESIYTPSVDAVEEFKVE
jgi:hypothetical protein